eukprot:UN34178
MDELIHFDIQLRNIWKQWFGRIKEEWWTNDLFNTVWVTDMWLQVEKDHINDNLEIFNSTENIWEPIDRNENKNNDSPETEAAQEETPAESEYGLTKCADFFLSLLSHTTGKLNCFTNLLLRKTDL